MNNLDTLNLKETVLSILHEIKTQNPHFFTDHLNILTWKSKKIPGALITKVNGQRYLGLPRQDIRGQEYWKYQPLTTSEPSGEEKSDQPPLDSLTKFNQSQEKTQTYVKSNANSSSSN